MACLPLADWVLKDRGYDADLAVRPRPVAQTFSNFNKNGWGGRIPPDQPQVIELSIDSSHRLHLHRDMCRTIIVPMKAGRKDIVPSIHSKQPSEGAPDNT